MENINLFDSNINNNVDINQKEAIEQETINKSWNYKFIKKHGLYNHIIYSNLWIILFFLLIFAIPFILCLILSIVVKVHTYNVFIFIFFGVICFAIYMYFVFKKTKLNIKYFQKKDNYGYIFFFYFCIVPIIDGIFSSLLLTNTSNINQNSWYTFGINLFHIFLLALIITWVCIKNKIFFNWFKKAFKKENIWIILAISFIGLILFLVLQFALGLIPNAIDKYNVLPQPLQPFNKDQYSLMVLSLLTLFISSVLIAPIIEEIMYRHFISEFTNHTWVGWFMSTVLFATMHIVSNGDFINIFPYFAMGIVNGFIYYWIRNLTPCIAIHFFGNLIAYSIIANNIVSTF